MAYTDILYEKKDGVAWVTINRPDVRNAFRTKTVEELTDAFNDARWDRSVGEVVLTGAGDKAFCAGGDQKERGQGGDTPGLRPMDVEALHSAIRHIPKPVIAMVNGFAIGGGHVLHVLCDLSIAADTAVFGQMGPRVGSVDAGHGTGYLARVGFVVKPAAGPLPVGLGALRGLPMVVFLVGFVLTAVLVARRVPGGLLVGIVVTTVIAVLLNGLFAGFQGFATPGAAQLPAAIVQAPDFSTFGRLDFGLFAKLGALAAILAIFSLMLSDFFDTMGTVIGVGGKGGFIDARGQLPRVDRVLLVDSLAAVAGGVANSSSNTTYIESAAGVAEGGRTGLVSVVVGVLFLFAMFFAPLAGIIPAQATAPALVLVGFFMMSVVREMAWDDYEETVPAFVTMLVMPFTWSITNGIGAGFITFVAIKVFTGRVGAVHPMLWVASAAFVLYFALPLLSP